MKSHPKKINENKVSFTILINKELGDAGIEFLVKSNQ